MARFDADFAIFGTFAADITKGVNIGEMTIDYANTAGIELYGDLRGKTIQEIIAEISHTPLEARDLLKQLNDNGELSYEGTLAGKFVKYHSRVIDCRDDESCGIDKFIQIGITDISEIVALKSLLYDTSEALKRAAKAADEDTGSHVARINQYSGLLAQLGNCEPKFVADIAQFAQLHDIGKIKVAETIRLPRKLSQDEIITMKKHTIYGGDMVKGLTGLEMAYNIALEHHEKWDGSGYPSGIKQKAISLEARIVAIADVFDALVSARPYKEAFGYEKTFEIFKNGDGRVMPSHFDPELLQLFLENYAQFVELHKTLKN
jgi:response regulator RpfG family c-di-GMP phosphodiesterase